MNDSTVFFGTSSLAVPLLNALTQSKWRPSVVITAPDRPGGRGLKKQPSPVKQKALGLGLDVWEPDGLDVRVADRLRVLKPDIIILSAYGAIIPPRILDIPRSGSLNVHPSLLPRWRGPAPIQYALLAGDKTTGVTIFLMDKEMDHGPVLAHASFRITADDTTATLEEKLGARGALLLLETLPRWLAGNVTPQPQDHSRATFSKRIKKEDGLIDWSGSAEEISRRVRAFYPWPGSYTFWHRNGTTLRLNIIQARPFSPEGTTRQSRDGLSPGTVFTENKKIFVATGKDALEILGLQPEGKKSMTAQQFLNGYREILGKVLD